jgi:hypothetical protein
MINFLQSISERGIGRIKSRLPSIDAYILSLEKRLLSSEIQIAATVIPELRTLKLNGKFSWRYNVLNPTELMKGSDFESICSSIIKKNQYIKDYKSSHYKPQLLSEAKVIANVCATNEVYLII